MVRILILLLFGFSALGQKPIVWDGQFDKINIGNEVFLLEDSENNLSITEVSAPEYKPQFTRSEKQILSFGDTSFYWIKFNIENLTQDQLILELAQPLIYDIEFYYKDTLNSDWQKLKSGFNIPISKKPYRHHFHLFPILKGSHEYYLRLQSKSMAIPLKLWEVNKYEVKSTYQKIIFGVFSGFMFFVIIINIFFFFSLGKFPHLHYAILVTLYYFTAINVEGFAAYLFPYVDMFYGMFIVSIFNMPIGVSFVMLFLETKKYTPSLYKIGIGLIIYYISFIFLHLFFSTINLVYITNFNGLLVVLIMASFGIQVGRKGNKMGYYYFVAYMLFFILAALDTKSKLTGSPPYIFDLSYVSIGFLVEALGLSYLLTLRFEWEKQSYLQNQLMTQSLLIEQTQENERIVLEQNTILEQKVSARTTELQKSLDELKKTQTQLVQSEKLASLGELTAGIAHEIQNPLNFVNNFSEINKELIVELIDEIEKGDFEVVKEIAKDIMNNEDKILHHGTRADAIVKGMLMHSRTNTGNHELTDVNNLCDEYLRLAYHGLRAKDKSFNAHIETDFDKDKPEIKLNAQDIGRVILNLITNAFHAVRDRSKHADKEYKPTVLVGTKYNNGKLEIFIKDNGVGIPENLQNKIFQPFFTTKPTGEGTGLGLSLSYDIIKSHGGNITFDSIKDKGTTFKITI
jgi:signal transduction histidine kinase